MFYAGFRANLKFDQSVHHFDNIRNPSSSLTNQVTHYSIDIGQKRHSMSLDDIGRLGELRFRDIRRTCIKRKRNSVNLIPDICLSSKTIVSCEKLTKSVKSRKSRISALCNKCINRS